MGKGTKWMGWRWIGRGSVANAGGKRSRWVVDRPGRIRGVVLLRREVDNPKDGQHRGENGNGSGS